MAMYEQCEGGTSPDSSLNILLSKYICRQIRSYLYFFTIYHYLNKPNVGHVIIVHKEHPPS